MTDWRRSLQFKKWDSMSDVLHAGRIFHLDWVFFFLDLLVLPFWVTLFVFSPMKPCFVRCVLDKWNCGILVSWLLRFRGLFFFFLSNSHHFMLPPFCPCKHNETLRINICFCFFCLCIFSFFFFFCFFHPMRICIPVITECHIRQSDHVRITTS